MMMATTTMTTTTGQEGRHQRQQAAAAASAYHTFANSSITELNGSHNDANQLNTYAQMTYYDNSESSSNSYYEYRDKGGRRPCYAPSYQEEFWQRPKPVFRPQGQLGPINIRYKPQQYLFRNCSMYYCTTTPTNIDYRQSFPNSSAHQFNGQYRPTDAQTEQLQQQHHHDGSVPFIMTNNQYVNNCTPMFNPSGSHIQPVAAAAPMGVLALNPNRCAQFYPVNATGCFAQQAAPLRHDNINYDGLAPPPPPAAAIMGDMEFDKAGGITDDEVRRFELNRADVQISTSLDPSLPLSHPRGCHYHNHHPGYLGGGTFGYVCSGLVHGSKCAVKVSRGLGRSSMDGQDPQFIREVSTLSQLQSHPNIVTMIGYVTADAATVGGDGGGGRSSCLLVMEEMATSLQAVIEGVSPLPVPSTLTRIGILRDVSSALDFMHSQGYVHRDIKPANVLLSHSYIAKLCDFGGCFTVEELDNGAATAACATVEYACPNHPLCQQCSCDIYSLGLVMVQVVYLIDIYRAKDRLSLRDPPNAQLADMMDVADTCMIPDDRARPSSRYLWDHFAMAFSHLTSSYSTPSTKSFVHRGTSYRRYFSGGSATSQQSDRKKKCKQSTMPPNIRRVFVPKSGVPLRSPTVLVGS